MLRDNTDMDLIDRLVVILSKFVSFVSTTFHLGAGATWPGEIALTLRPHIAASLAKEFQKGVILVVGTNGKTTTSLMLKTILEHVGDVVIHNATGANLLNGVVSSFIRHADFLGRITADVGIFEVDENSLPIVLRYMKPSRIVVLNLFRDQLDRYGEVDVIIEKWEKAFAALPKETQVIINADDPGVAYLGKSVPGTVIYFGVQDKTKFLNVAEHATDSTFCPKCGNRLRYDGIYFSHLGLWTCPACGYTRPVPSVSAWPNPLPGLYNQYNTLAAVAVAGSLSVRDTDIAHALKSFKPAFGRQEEIVMDGRTVKIFLSKNPAGFNASLRTVIEQRGQYFLFALNDRIPDGRDVSWIWDVDFETLPKSVRVTVSGDRVYDMALRLKYAGVDTKRMDIEPNLMMAVTDALARVPKGQTLYVLPTYSAMLDIREILTGKKIL